MGACKFEYKGKKYNEKEVTDVISYHYAVEDRLLESNLFIKNDNTIILKEIIESEETTNLNIDKLVNTINKDMGLGAEIVSLNEGVIQVDVNPIAQSIISKEEYSVEEINLNFDSDKRITLNTKGISEETLEVAQDKIDTMEKRFSELGIPTHIILNGDLKESGEVLGTDTELYKQLVAEGSINEGDAVIQMNPRTLNDETVFHEYAHVFIDLAGGMNNPRIKYAYAKLKGTQLHNEVETAYPSLTGEALAKEVLAHAMGREANEIFSNNKTNANFFQKFLDWIRETVRNIMGLPTDSIRSLSNEMLGNTEATFSFDSMLSSYSQQFKNTKENREERNKRNKVINQAQNTKESIEKRINNAYATISKSQDPSKVALREKLTNLKSTLEQYSNVSNLLAINHFMQEVSNISDALNGTLNMYQDQINKGEFKGVDIYLLDQIDMYTNIFDIVKDVASHIDEGTYQKEFAKEGWDDATQQIFKNLAQKLRSDFDSLKNKHIRVGRQHIATKLLPYSNRMVVTRRIELEKEYKEMYPRKANEGSEEYNKRIRNLINETIQTEYAELRQAEKDYILDRLERSPTDIGSFASWVSSEKDLNSMVIQLASKLLDESDLLRDSFMLTKKQEAFEVFKIFDAETSGMDAREKYKGLYHEGSDGNLYITSEYNVEWYIQRNEAWNKYFAMEETSPEKSKALEAALKWDEENSDIIKDDDALHSKIQPKAKWKSKEFSDIMSKPTSGKARMLEFLINQTKENSKLLHGNLSLIKNTSSSEIEFYQAPSIGKSLYEKVTTGNLFHNIKDSAQRIFKVKTDDTDLVGQTDDGLKQEEKDVLRTLVNAKGEEKYGVPIHFRGKIDLKDVSYDLMSSVLTDAYMAANYHYKTGIQIELELMRDIVAEKKIDKTRGLRKQLLINATNKEDSEKIDPMKGEDSNEYKVFKSIVENRLYGIKTADPNYAKLASSLMSWSASSMLIFNLPSGIVNAVQGSIFNFIEAVGGEHFKSGNLVNANKEYLKDLSSVANDIGRSVATSKTNQLMELLNIQGEFKALSNKLIENNRFKALAKKHTGFGFNHMGENYMHGVLMYAILDKIKVKNDQGQFIDKNGKVVTEDKAMNLHQAISVGKDNKLTLNPNVSTTTFGNSVFNLDPNKGKGLLEVKNLVNKIAHDLHGNYSDEIQIMAQRYIAGKMVFMLRKWMVPGFNKRWRGAVNFNKKTSDLRDEMDNMYSEDLQSFQEGYYTTGARFLWNIKDSFNELGFQVLSTNWDRLTDAEKANMKRLATELGIMLMTFISSYLLLALAQGVDDPTEKQILFYMTYLTRRIFSEFHFYTSPLEAFKIMSTPSATLSYVAKMGKFAGQAMEDIYNLDIERYERGRHKDKSKLWKKTMDLLPGANQYYRDIEESTSWLFGVY